MVVFESVLEGTHFRGSFEIFFEAVGKQLGISLNNAMQRNAMERSLHCDSKKACCFSTNKESKNL